MNALESMLAATPGVCACEEVRGSATDSTTAASLLIEIPHGATRESDFTALLGRLSGEYPKDLREFFFVNTDVGSYEIARRIAERVTEAQPERRVLILRCLVPRTFIDCNRVEGMDAAAFKQGGVTPLLPGYVTDPVDRRELTGLHQAYRQIAELAYETVCSRGGLGLIPHTYAPRSIQIDSIDADIVSQLRQAYEPQRYSTWPLRPDVDMISATDDGTRLAPGELIDRIREHYSRIGIEAVENATYRLHPSTMAYQHCSRYPGQVLCIEFNRALLAAPFDPFVEMVIGEEPVGRMAEPVAAAICRTLAA